MSEIKKNDKGQVILTVAGILEDLDQGLTREDIQEKYGLTPSDLTRLFQNPELKGKKTRRMPGFVLQDPGGAIDAPSQVSTDDAPEGGGEDLTEEKPNEVTDSVFEQPEV